VEGFGADLVGTGLFDRVQVDGLVFDPERVLEALELRDAHVQRHLPALERGGDRGAGLLALGAAAGGLADTAANATSDAFAVAFGALGGLEVVNLHGVSPSWTSSTSMRNGTRAIMPRISGRSGSVLDWPMPRRPSARRVP